LSGGGNDLKSIAASLSDSLFWITVPSPAMPQLLMRQYSAMLPLSYAIPWEKVQRAVFSPLHLPRGPSEALN
jgi:hypothetical protein